MSDIPLVKIRNGLPVVSDIIRLAVANYIPKPRALAAKNFTWVVFLVFSRTKSNSYSCYIIGCNPKRI